MWKYRPNNEKNVQPYVFYVDFFGYIQKNE